METQPPTWRAPQRVRCPGALGASALLPPGCALGLAFQAGREHRDGTQGPPRWCHQRCHWMARRKRRILGADSGAGHNKAGLSVSTHLMQVMRVLGLRWQSRGHHGADVPMANTRPNSGSQEQGKPLPSSSLLWRFSTPGCSLILGGSRAGPPHVFWWGRGRSKPG